VAIYARVSSADQRNDLDRQVSRLVLYANKKGLLIAQTITEIGSGLNGHRPKLMKLLANPIIKVI
jgi:predicted site-specific integrase-resolvase